MRRAHLFLLATLVGGCTCGPGAVSPDGGSDSGNHDAGPARDSDGGTFDGGTDAGSLPSDAGTDAGTPIDAGTFDAGAFAANCVEDGWCWNHPYPTGAGFAAAWAFSPTDVWLVGVAGTSLHWDGAVWTRWETGTRQPLTALWGSAPNALWAAGWGGTLLQWNGAAWSSVASSTANSLYALWGSASSDVWAAGDGDTLLHYDGAQWTRYPTAGTTNGYRTLWGSASDSLYVAGATNSGGVMDWDGGSWSPIALPSAFTGTPTHLAASGPNDLWLTGTTGGFGELLHSADGVNWTLPNIPSNVQSLQAVTAFSPTDVWCGGMEELSHWDGTNWTVNPLAPSHFITSFTGTGPDDLWAAGNSGRILHRSAGSWNVVAPGGQNYMGFDAVWVGSPNDAWASGHAGVIRHWDGTSWTDFPTGLADEMTGAWGSATNDVYIVGSNGNFAGAMSHLFHWDGNQLASSMAPITAYSVWGSAANDVYLAGPGGHLVHWNGTTWSPTTLSTPNDLESVFGSGPNDVWVVGINSTAFHWNGTAWTPTALPASIPPGGTIWLLEGRANAPNDAWAAGFADLLHWDGNSWSRVTPPSNALVSAIWSAGANDLWLGDEASTVWHWNGSTWRQSAVLPMGVGSFGGTAADLWLVGGPEAVLRRQ